MNRFFKKNISLIGILALTVVIGLGLLVYTMIINSQRAGYNADTDKLVARINDLVKQNPAPVEENKPLLRQDIALYGRISKELRSCFADPMMAATDEFLKTLRTEPEKDAEGKTLPPQPVTKEKFLEMFRPEWEQIPADNFPKKEYFLRLFRRRFQNWYDAQKSFIAKAKDLTIEPVDQVNADALMFATLGFPRQFEKPEELRRTMASMRNRINEIAADKVTVPYEATSFGFDMSNPGLYQAADYPLIIKHWENLGDLVKRLVGSNVKMLHGIKIRIRPGEQNSLQGSVETAGAYKLYHYTLEISGSMAAIRKYVQLLDTAYPEQHVYLVRSVFLYAEENGAAAFFASDDQPEAEKGKQETAAPVVRRGRGRGRGRERAEEEERQKSEDEKKEREERLREEKRRLREAKLPPHERAGYGNVLIGQGEEYRAIIDVDRVVLNQ